MVRRRHPQLRRKRSQLDFLWPFLLIIFTGIILVLLTQLVFSWLDQRDAELKNKVYLYLDQGNARILPWGETEWSKAYHGQIVLEGDRLQVATESRGVLSFYNDTLVRMDSSSDVSLETLRADQENDSIELKLKQGRIWSNIVQNSYGESSLSFVVETEHLRVTSQGTVFEIERTDREAVRVLEDSVLVEFVDRSQGDEVVLETWTVGVGQQIELYPNDIEILLSHQPLSVLEALDDSWKVSSWATWNREQDENPTNFSQLSDEMENAGEGISLEPSEEPLEEVPEETAEEEPAMPQLQLTSPETNSYALPPSQRSISLEGTTSTSTVKITVTSYDENGIPTSYVLKNFKEGNATWRYNAAFEYNNLHEGRNRFVIVAENSEGLESDPLEVIIEVSQEAADATVSEAEASETSSAMDLAVPQVVTINGEPLPEDGVYRTSAETLTIVGSVGTGAVAVYVNEFKLSKYQEGSSFWSYYANASYGNYAVGENTYTVYAKDAQGNKTPVETFKVIYESA